jgi:hypothetical protein
MRPIRTIVRLAPFWGDNLILVMPSMDPTIPEGLVGLPGQLIDDWNAEEIGARLAIATLGDRKTSTLLERVDRLYVAESDTDDMPDHVFLNTCVVFGYPMGIRTKPDKLPSNFDPRQRVLIERLMSWRKYKGLA